MSSDRRVRVRRSLNERCSPLCVVLLSNHRRPPHQNTQKVRLHIDFAVNVNLNESKLTRIPLKLSQSCFNSFS